MLSLPSAEPTGSSRGRPCPSLLLQQLVMEQEDVRSLGLKPVSGGPGTAPRSVQPPSLSAFPQASLASLWPSPKIEIEMSKPEREIVNAHFLSHSVSVG